MTPADPSLLAQLRQLREEWLQAELRDADRIANGQYSHDAKMSHIGIATALRLVEHKLDAILEAQPPETLEPNFIVRGPYVMGGWERRVGDAELLDTVLDAAHMSPLGEATVIPLVPKHLRQPPETAPTPLVISAAQLEVRAVNHRNAGRKDLAQALEQAARDRRTIEAANTAVTVALWGVERPHEDQLVESIRALATLCAPTPDPPAETCAECRHAAHQPGRCLNAASDNECACGATVPRPADTPTGLAPLRKISKSTLDAAQKLGSISGQQFQQLAWPAGQLALCDVLVELDAQRQASASVRREAMLDWEPMSTAPKTGYPIQHAFLLVEKARHNSEPIREIVHAHWAHGDGDGMMPAFGPAWFRSDGCGGYYEVSGKLLGWQPAPPAREPRVSPRQPSGGKRNDDA